MRGNQQGEQYLDLLFADHRGYVAVAAKNGAAGAWSEQVFSWPDDRGLLLSWAQANRAGDVFICPALRRTKGRTKNDGAHLQWLWADIDWQDVPATEHARIRERISKMASFTVASGSGDNVHVYVKLNRPATLEIWRRLNAGLRAYLSADAKHTDNALLRLPGTINHKPGGGKVTAGSMTGKTADATQLLEHKAWRDVLVTDDRATNDGTYDTVDISDLLRGEVKRRVRMDTDEATGRYGTRHGAVYQVTQWLSKRGLTSDQIHSLMAEFPAGVDKQDDEHGYSLHVDIARCLSANPTVEALEIVEDLFEVLEDGEEGGVATDDTMMNAARKRLRTMDVEDLARQMRAQRMFTPPPDDVSYTWGQRRATPRPPVQFAVENIAAVGQNVTITGQYKAGKTLLGLNLMRSLVDGEPFLGEFKVGGSRGGSSRVGFWSMEMSVTDLDAYLDPLGYTDDGAGRLAVLSGRGYGVNLMTDVGKQWAINWLKQMGCGVWVIDSHARMCRMSGIDENENGAVLGLLHRLDEIKEASGVGELFYLVHTGRGSDGSDAGGVARARGATVLDDWADARWVLTRQGSVRFLSVEGRSVRDMAARSITFDGETGAMTLGMMDPVTAKVDGLTALIVSLVTDHAGEYNTRALRAVVRERAGQASTARIKDAIEDAVRLGALRCVDGPRGEKRYWPGTVPERAGESGTVDEGDETGDGKRAEREWEINPKGMSDLQIRAEAYRRAGKGRSRGGSDGRGRGKRRG